MREDFVCVPIPARVYAEFVLRLGSADTVQTMIEHAVKSFLDNTAGDEGLWGEDHADKFAEETSAKGNAEWAKKFGDRKGGYHWTSVFLPNGTQLRMTYRGTIETAEIRHDRLWFKNAQVSPSEFASKVASNTSRNAWRDIWIRRPTDERWIHANDLRRLAGEELKALLR